MSEKNTAQPAAVSIGPEVEHASGWTYRVTVTWRDATETEHTVSLGHHDYEYWCGGIEPPSRIAQRGVNIAARELGPNLPGKFDLSQMRRRIDRFDDMMLRGE